MCGLCEFTHSFVSISAGPDPVLPDFDLVYVGYTDYGADPPANHVAVLRGSVPTRRLRDRVVSASPRAGALAAAALRVAADPARGAVYALWQDPAGVDPASCARRVDLRLARSLDGGDTWDAGDSARGTLIAETRSFQGRNDASSSPASCRRINQKFGGVNALLGGTAALAVDLATGDALIAFADLGPTASTQAIFLARVTFGGAGEPPLVSVHPVSTGASANAALPSVAAEANGTVGVLYDTYDGKSGHRPRFTTHLAQSVDGGATFVDQALVSFVSPVASNAHAAQRALGDYQQMKAVGGIFYAAFPANGAEAGRPIESIDPFFARVPALPRAP